MMKLCIDMLNNTLPYTYTYTYVLKIKQPTWSGFLNYMELKYKLCNTVDGFKWKFIKQR